MRERPALKTLLAAGSIMALALASPASAQDHSEHGQASPPAPADDAPEEDYCVVALESGRSGIAIGGGVAQTLTCGDEAVGHPQMDHGQMDRRVVAEGALDDAAKMRDCMETFSHGVCQAMIACETASCGAVGMRIGPIDASGTSRLPQAEGMMPGVHFNVGGGWMGMAHVYAWGVYTDQSGPRGDDMAFVQSMAMLMAEKAFDGGRLQLKGMLSADPLIGDRGYPILFGAGETANGLPLVDRQHPHDLFMELAARLDFDIADGTRAFVYAAPVGEPALGPPAFMHRASARLNPEAPITHHWFDSTHITFGVLTAGVASSLWQVEASAFRGREPDEDRWDIEEPRLDSWSVRATLTPSPNWAMQVSYGRLDEPEPLHPGEDEGRTTASVHYNSGNGFAATAAFSAKDRIPGETLTAWLAEANWDITQRHTLFGRFENVRNDELFPDHLHPLHDQPFRISKLQAGYAYTLPAGPFGLSLGGSVATFIKPDALDPFYGRSPMGYTLFAKLTLGH